MTSRPFVRNALLACLAAGSVAACSGSDGVASPGEGIFVTSPPPAAPPPPASPPAGPPASPPSGPAAACPTGTNSVGTIATTEGTLRNCQLPTKVVGASALEISALDGVIYSLAGRTDVGDDQGADPAAPIAGRQPGTLIINEGVTLFGSTSSDYIVVNRGAQIRVNGSASAPVIMTGRQDVIDSSTADVDQQWGGLIVLGRAPISTCPSGTSPAPTVTAPNVACEDQIEGADFALYGGATHNDNSGSINYLRISFGGVEIGAGNEINGLTMGGVGAATTVENVQVHQNFDDGIELFGGRVNIRNAVLTGIGDDSLDLDSGWTGAVQGLIIYQTAGRGDHAFEFGDVDTQPLTTHSKISNATIIQTATQDDTINVKEEHMMDLYNSVLVRADASQSCIKYDAVGGAFTNTPTFNSVVLSCASNSVNAEGDAALAAGSNNNTAFTSSLTGTFINGASENGVTVTAPVNHPFGSGTPASSFLTTPSNIGAVYPGNDTWYQGWTCALPGTDAC